MGRSQRSARRPRGNAFAGFAPAPITAVTQAATAIGNGRHAAWSGQYKGCLSDLAVRVRPRLPYGKTTPIHVISSGWTAPVAVAVKLVKLAAHTTYHFRVVVSQCQGPGQKPVAVDGRDMTFTTK